MHTAAAHKTAAFIAVTIAAIYTTLVAVVFVAAVAPGIAAVVMWWQNRHALEELTRYLAEQASKGQRALEG